MYTVSYQITGFCQRVSALEDYSSPGYTAITMNDGSAAGKTSFTCLVTLKNPRDVYAFVDKAALGHSVIFHENLLIYLGVSDNANFYLVIRKLAVILILLIMTGSVALIYNAFSISFSERTKQFGLLSSIGASPKQLSRAILQEAGIISLTGIPIGLLCGIGGIVITLYFVGGLDYCADFRQDTLAQGKNSSATLRSARPGNIRWSVTMGWSPRRYVSAPSAMSGCAGCSRAAGWRKPRFFRP